MFGKKTKKVIKVLSVVVTLLVAAGMILIYIPLF